MTSSRNGDVYRASRILSRAFWGDLPGLRVDLNQALEKLHEKKVISKDLYEQLRGLGGFRKILVHGYLSLNLELAQERPGDRGPLPWHGVGGERDGSYPTLSLKTCFKENEE